MQSIANRHGFDLTNVDADALSNRLLADGYVIAPGLLDPKSTDRLCSELDSHFEAAAFGRGMFYGAETKRFGAVLKRSREAQDIVMHPTVMHVAECAIGAWCQCLQLNLTQAIEIYPGASVQAPHRDQDMWAGPKGAIQYMVNVMWALDDFTAENGAARAAAQILKAAQERDNFSDRTAKVPVPSS